MLYSDVFLNIYVGYTLCFDNVNLKTTTRHQTKTSLRNTYNLVQVHITETDLDCKMTFKYSSCLGLN